VSRATTFLLGVLGGVTVVVATAAGWLTREETRSVGGVELGEAVSVSGTEVAPALVTLGLIAIGLAVIVAILPGLLRRVAGLALVGLGVASTVTAVMTGFVQLDLAGAQRTPAAAFAAFGGLVVAAAGYFATRPAPVARGASRYDVDADKRHADTEWEMAADEPPAQDPPAG